MATQVQFRGGTTAQNDAFTGASKELTVDTDKDVVVVHDGSTTGGHPLMAEDGSNSELALGNAGTPALKFTDTNTGIYSPGADQIAFSTGGTGRLFIDSAGNVGIGDSTPGAKLDVNGNVQFGDGGGFDMNINGTRHQFSIGSSEKMRITSAGNVGIGNTAPSAKLHISDPGAPEFRIVDTTNNCTGFMRPVDSSVRFGTGSDHPLEFHINSSERMRLNSSGQVIIGGTSPLDNDKQLTLTTASTSGGLGILSPNDGRGDIFFGDAADDNIGQIKYNHVDDSLTIRTNAADRFTIDSSGNVGVGTTSPAAKTHISNSYSAPTGGHDSNLALVVSNSGAANNFTGIGIASGSNGGSFIHFGDEADDNVGAISYFHDSNSLTFTTAASERLRIDSSGNVGVGESNPDQRLHVKTSGDDVVKFESTSGGNGPNLTFAHTGASPADNDVTAKLTFNATNDASQETTFADIKVITTDVSDGSEDAAFAFSTRNNGVFDERLRIKSDGTINFANVQTFADDAAAGTGGLVSGDVYKTSAGDLKIKA